jgi:hypothetical protein
MGSTMLLAMASANCNPTKPNPKFQNTVIRCDVTRRECLREGPGITCAEFSDPLPFSATACGQDGADIDAVCMQEFCTQPSGIAYPYPMGCDAKGTDVTATIPANGTCRTNFSTGTRLALAS